MQTEESNVIVRLNSEQAVAAIRELKKEQDILNASLKAMGKDDPERVKLKLRIAEIKEETRKLKDQLKDKIELIIDGKVAGENINELKRAAALLRSQINTLPIASDEFIAKSKRLSEVTAELDKVQNKAKETHGAFQKVKEMLSAIGIATGIYELASEFKSFISDSIKAFVDYERAAQKLSFGITQVLGGTKEEVKALRQEAESLSKTTFFTPTTILQSQAMQAEFGLTADRIKELTPSIQNLASELDVDLKTATEIALRAIEGTTRGLKVIGADFETTGSKVGNYNMLIEKLSKINGAAAEALKTTSGQMKEQEKEVEILSEEVGSRFAKAWLNLKEIALSTIIGIGDSWSKMFGGGGMSFDEIFASRVELVRRSAQSRPTADLLKEFDKLELKQEELRKKEGTASDDNGEITRSRTLVLAQMQALKEVIDGRKKEVAEKDKDTEDLSRLNRKQLEDEIKTLKGRKDVATIEVQDQISAREEQLKNYDSIAEKKQKQEEKSKDQLLKVINEYNQSVIDGIQDEASKELALLEKKYADKKALLEKEVVKGPDGAPVPDAASPINSAIHQTELQDEINFQQEKTTLILSLDKKRMDQQLKQDLDNLTEWNDKEKTNLNQQLADGVITQDIFNKRNSDQQQKYLALKIINLNNYFRDTKKIEEEINALQKKQESGTATKEDATELVAKKKQLDDYLEYNKNIQKQITQTENEYSTERINQNKAALETQQKELNGLLSRATKDQKMLMLDYMKSLELYVATGINSTGIPIDELLKKMDKLWAAIGERNEKGFEDWQISLQKWLAKYGQFINEFTNAVSSIWSNLNKIADNKDKAHLENLKRGYDKDKQHFDLLLKKKLISQEQYDEKIQALQDAQDKAGRKAAHDAAKRARDAALFNAIIGGAQAVIQALASYPPPYSYILAAISAIAAGVEIAAIESEPLPPLGKGHRFENIGKHPESNQKVKGPDGTFVVEENETLLSSKTRNKNPEIVDDLLDGSLNRDGRTKHKWVKQDDIEPQIEVADGSRGIANVLGDKKQKSEIKPAESHGGPITSQGQVKVNKSSEAPKLEDGGVLSTQGQVKVNRSQPVENKDSGILLDGSTHEGDAGGMPIINPSTGKPVAIVEGGELILSKKWVKENPELATQALHASQKNNGVMDGLRPSIPAWWGEVPKLINIDRIISARNLERFDDGGIFGNSIFGSRAIPNISADGSRGIANIFEAQQQTNERMMQLIEKQNGAIEQLNAHLKRGIKAGVVLSELELKQRELELIRRSSNIREPSQ